jgi:ABC-type branched-subunit amino acid transport system ATPase component
MLILDLADEGHVLGNGSVVLSGRARGTGGDEALGDACFGCAAA